MSEPENSLCPAQRLLGKSLQRRGQTQRYAFSSAPASRPAAVSAASSPARPPPPWLRPSEGASFLPAAQLPLVVRSTKKNFVHDMYMYVYPPSTASSGGPQPPSQTSACAAAAGQALGDGRRGVGCDSGPAYQALHRGVRVHTRERLPHGLCAGRSLPPRATCCGAHTRASGASRFVCDADHEHKTSRSAAKDTLARGIAHVGGRPQEGTHEDGQGQGGG